jgi:hypothetical protein
VWAVKATRMFDRLGFASLYGRPVVSHFASALRYMSHAMSLSFSHELERMLFGVRPVACGSRRLFDWIDGARRPRVRFAPQGLYVETVSYFTLTREQP